MKNLVKAEFNDVAVRSHVGIENGKLTFKVNFGGLVGADQRRAANLILDHLAEELGSLTDGFFNSIKAIKRPSNHRSGSRDSEINFSG